MLSADPSVEQIDFLSEIDRNYLCVTPRCVPSMPSPAPADSMPPRTSSTSRQPTLTAQVAALEAEYGVELFMKQGRHSRLTDAGRSLLAITTRMFLEEQEALAYLEQSRELRTGRLAIGAVSPYHVTEMLAAFQRKYPGIELSVSLGNTADVLQRAARLPHRRRGARLYGSRRAGAADPAPAAPDRGVLPQGSSPGAPPLDSPARSRGRAHDRARARLDHAARVHGRAGGSRRHAERRDGDRQPRRRCAKP